MFLGYFGSVLEISESERERSFCVVSALESRGGVRVIGLGSLIESTKTKRLAQGLITASEKRN